MVRSVALFQFRPGTTQQQIDTITDALQSQDIPGLVTLSSGADPGLREGNLSLAFVLDFQDERAFRSYGAGEQHNRIRREVVARITERVERWRRHTFLLR